MVASRFVSGRPDLNRGPHGPEVTIGESLTVDLMVPFSAIP